MDKIRFWYNKNLEDCKKDVEFLRGKYKKYGVKISRKVTDLWIDVSDASEDYVEEELIKDLFKCSGRMEYFEYRMKNGYMYNDFPEVCYIRYDFDKEKLLEILEHDAGVISGYRINKILDNFDLIQKASTELLMKVLGFSNKKVICEIKRRFGKEYAKISKNEAETIKQFMIISTTKL